MFSFFDQLHEKGNKLRNLNILLQNKFMVIHKISSLQNLQCKCHHLLRKKKRESERESGFYENMQDFPSPS